MDQRIVVRAPATSANLGPAFDAAGVALDWWDELGAVGRGRADLELGPPVEGDPGGVERRPQIGAGGRGPDVERLVHAREPTCAGSAGA